ncbi:MAG: integration host factor subunit alpha [Desulfobacca sp.]|nr:integration host factor subunit alpha [Desulfobacca sp.]
MRNVEGSLDKQFWEAYRQRFSGTLTKAKLSAKLVERRLATRKEAARLVETIFDLIKLALEHGEDVLISGFGKFFVRDKDRRRGRNPQTNEDLMLDARRVVVFRCSGVLKDKINRPRDQHQNLREWRRWRR